MSTKGFIDRKTFDHEFLGLVNFMDRFSGCGALIYVYILCEGHVPSSSSAFCLQLCA